MHAARIHLVALALLASLNPSRAAEPVAAAAMVEVQEPVFGSAPTQARMRERIRAFEAGGKAGLPDMMRLVRDDGQPFYLVQSLCCDQFNPLYDAQGRYVCAPSGGFGGGGDGRCPAWARGLRFGLPKDLPDASKPKAASAN